jgi:high-affinity iron transporter
VTALLLFALSAPAAGAGTSAVEPPTDARLLVGVLDYVASDYGGAVRGGKVRSEAEYREQLSFVREARAAAGRVPGLPSGIPPALDELDGALRRLAPAAEVTGRCRAIRDEIVAKLRLIVAPAMPPPAGRGAALFAKLCVACHGEDGRAGTARARELSPPPRDFHDRAVMRGLSPYRAFGALSFGVNGTAMAAFSALSEEDRWSLAFHVFSFLHASRAQAGRDALRRAWVRAPSLGEIALRSDDELEAEMVRSGMDARSAADAVSYLRVDGFRESADPLDEARRQVAIALRLHAEGHAERAAQTVIQAYFAFERVEARLGARDRAMVGDGERGFTGLRDALRAGAPAEEVRARAEALDRFLGQAQAVLTRSTGGRLAFLGSLIIFLREGIEAALLVGLLLGVIARSGRPGMRRVVHLGWTSAAAAGLCTFWAASRILRAQSLNHEVLEGVVSLLAAAVLFYVTYWTLSQAQSQRWTRYLRGQVEGARGRAALLFGLAFFAVYREAFEAVLFYQALLLERDADRLAIFAGAGVGAGLVVIAVWILRRAGTRLPLQWFFNLSGAALCLLAVVFVGAGLHALRQGGWMRSHPVGLPPIEWLGLYPDTIGLLVQGTMVLLVAGGTMALFRHRRA